MSETEPVLKTHADFAAELSTKAKREATQWKREHALEFYRMLWACDDVQTLRALAHRLGYKEGT